MSDDLAYRVESVHRYGSPIPPVTRAAATALLTDMLAAAAKHNVTLADFDFVTDLPAVCLDVSVTVARHKET